MVNRHNKEKPRKRQRKSPGPAATSAKDLPHKIHRPKIKPKRRLLLITSAVALSLIGLALWLSRRHEQLYKVTMLPSLGATFTRPEAINDHGQIAGLANVAGVYHLFLWDSDNGMQDLGQVISSSVDINNAGQIAATMIDPNGVMQAFLWDPEDGRQMLATLDHAASAAAKLNNRGQVVGTLYPPSRRPPGTPLGIRQAFIWDKSNGMRKLFPSERRESTAFAINDAGQVMGSVGTYQSPRRPVPCFWDSTDPARERAPPLQPPIDYPAMDYPGGRDLNNNGYVTGRMYHWDRVEYWAILWKEGTGAADTKYLFPLEDSIGPMRINDANQVLYGEKHNSSLERISKKYFAPYAQRCLWDPKRGKIVLDKQVPLEIGDLIHVRDINNRGCIVGIIRSTGLGKELGVLLEPILERWEK